MPAEFERESFGAWKWLFYPWSIQEVVREVFLSLTELA